MKKTLFTLLLACWGTLSFSQLNMTLLDSKDYSQNLNDIWGWVDPDDGTEYALVGTVTGVSVVSLADPENIVEVAFLPGDNSTWRDIKTWGHYAYATADNGNNDGLMVIDLSDAPNNITFNFYAPNLPNIGGQYERSHNIYIDEFGYAYLAGSNLNSGGMIILDVFTTPGFPQFVAAAPNEYAHDVYVRDNRMYASEIYAGQFAVYDVADKSDIQLLATQLTPFQFTHNTWLNDAGDVIFTTDEQGNAPIGAYDISDLDNIVELDQFIPISTMGANVIPHNVHVWQDWLIISYYSDGGIIVDASKPDNLIEVGNWDTFLGGNGGFNGAWGAYPFLPSGIVLLTDIGNGLYVCGANYVRACWLEGTVTNSVTGAPILGAQVDIESPQANFATTGLDGHYETGQAIPGVFDVTFSAMGYYSKTVPATLENGVLTILDVQLDPKIPFTITGQTIQSADSSPLPGAQIYLYNAQGSYEFVSDANGNFTLADVLEGVYTVYVGAWGYEYEVIDIFEVDANTPQPLIVALDKGPYRDDFVLDFGWTVSGAASTGHWERGEPIGTEFDGNLANPELDVAGDIGELCYVTGNAGGAAANDDVDNGVTTLTSPVMALANFNDPVLRYSTWFFNDGGNGTPDDSFVISVTNGVDEVVLETITTSNSNWNPPSEFHLADHIALTDNVQVIFETSDLPGSGHLVEAAVDAFLVQESCVGPEVSFTYVEVDATVTFTNTSTGGTSVLWDFGDNSTSTEDNPSHTYAGPGEYEVTLTVSHDCGFTVSTLTIVIEASGTLDLDENGYALSALPNPFISEVLVNYELLDNFQQASLVVFDVLGKQVAHANLDANTGTVAFGSEIRESGVYFLRIVVDGKVGKAVRLVRI